MKECNLLFAFHGLLLDGDNPVGNATIPPLVVERNPFLFYLFIFIYYYSF